MNNFVRGPVHARRFVCVCAYGSFKPLYLFPVNKVFVCALDFSLAFSQNPSLKQLR
jgi:hypothetical protein